MSNVKKSLEKITIKQISSLKMIELSSLSIITVSKKQLPIIPFQALSSKNCKTSSFVEVIFHSVFIVNKLDIKYLTVHDLGIEVNLFLFTLIVFQENIYHA